MENKSNSKVETSIIPSTKSYITTGILGFLPFGIFALIFWARSGEVRESKRNFCKSLIILKLALVIPYIIISFILGYFLGSI